SADADRDRCAPVGGTPERHRPVHAVARRDPGESRSRGSLGPLSRPAGPRATAGRRGPVPALAPAIALDPVGRPRDLARRPVDLFHGCTGFELPRGAGARLVTTVHDLIPLRFPRLVPWRHRMAVRALLGSALRRAARVIAVSEATRTEILQRFRVPADKVQVVPEAASPRFAPPPAGEIER